MTRIEDLKRLIESTDTPLDVRAVKEWGGADVIIKSRLDAHTEKWLRDQPLVIGLQNTVPKRRAVITKYSKELSWLFYQLRDLFSEQIDDVSKYDFYGLLAQSAIDYLVDNEESQDAKDLLRVVLNTAKGFCVNEPSK
jgi:hypothetical protein